MKKQQIARIVFVIVLIGMALACIGCDNDGVKAGVATSDAIQAAKTNVQSINKPTGITIGTPEIKVPTLQTVYDAVNGVK